MKLADTVDGHAVLLTVEQQGALSVVVVVSYLIDDFYASCATSRC